MKALEHAMWLLGGLAIGLLTLIFYIIMKSQSAVNKLGILKIKLSGINYHTDKNIGLSLKLDSNKKDTTFKIKFIII